MCRIRNFYLLGFCFSIHNFKSNVTKKLIFSLNEFLNISKKNDQFRVSYGVLINISFLNYLYLIELQFLIIIPENVK